MILRPLESWQQVGQRVSAAREERGLTQHELASRIGIDRTALAKVETGSRSLSSLELARIAAELERQIQWFVSEPPPTVVSRRAASQARTDALDRVVDSFARDVELLVELGSLRPIERTIQQAPSTVDQAEALADLARKRRDLIDEPTTNLISVVEAFGLSVFVTGALSDATAEGAYVDLGSVGVAVINGALDAGRRRFTLAHELGHHLVADEYSTDWGIADSRDERERLINAFAIHFLMPRHAIASDWARLVADRTPREAAIRLATDYRVSWSAACTQLQNLQLIARDAADELRATPPTRGDFIEAGVFFVPELTPPALSPRFGQAVIRAYRSGKITAGRAVELLRGTLVEDDLPLPEAVPLDAVRGEIDDF